MTVPAGCRSAVVAVALVLAGALAACGPSASGPTVTVFAASSLTDAFAELEAAYEAAHPGEDVVVAHAGSQILRLQIEQGAPADVFASADAGHVDALGDAGRIAARGVFAAGALAVVVPRGNPAGIGSLEDLPRARRLVLGASEVPVGRYTSALLEGAAGRFGPTWGDAVAASVVSREPNVRLVLAKVVLGEADAAIVYASDAAAAGDDVLARPVPPELAPAIAYHQAVLREAPNPAGARRWDAFVRSPAARDVLAGHGFGARESSAPGPGP